uniref:hypothetical protein n=1 Tax=Shinella sp. TaxID=1870904 RepID=UPI004036E54F
MWLFKGFKRARKLQIGNVRVRLSGRLIGCQTINERWTRKAPRAIHSPMKKGDHLFLVDGSGFIFRAFHAIPPLTRKSDGLPVNAVSGFCNMLWKLLKDARNT